VVAGARPEREKVEARRRSQHAQAQLSAAESQVSAARTAEAGYPAAYASLVSLGKAVPIGQEVPSLIFQLERASTARASNSPRLPRKRRRLQHELEFGRGAAAAATGFTQMPFTFVFSGSFFDLYKLFQQIDHFTLRRAPAACRSAAACSPSGHSVGPCVCGEKTSSRLTGTITAPRMCSPRAQAASGASATSPTGAQTTSGSAPSSPATTLP